MLWVQCSDCEAWLHGGCVGIRSRRQVGGLTNKLHTQRTKKFNAFFSPSKLSSEEVAFAHAPVTCSKLHLLRIHIERCSNPMPPPPQADTLEFICPPCQAARAIHRHPRPSKTTLIVCPQAILGQWQGELARHIRPGALKVRVWCGGGDAWRCLAWEYHMLRTYIIKSVRDASFVCECFCRFLFSLS